MQFCFVRSNKSNKTLHYSSITARSFSCYWISTATGGWQHQRLWVPRASWLQKSRLFIIMWLANRERWEKTKHLLLLPPRQLFVLCCVEFWVSCSTLVRKFVAESWTNGQTGVHWVDSWNWNNSQCPWCFRAKFFFFGIDNLIIITDHPHSNICVLRSNDDCRWGFPIFSSLGQLNFAAGSDQPTAKLCVFNWPRQGRSPRTLCEQSGNAMNLLVMCALQLHSMVCLKFQHIPTMLTCIAQSRKSSRQQKRTLTDGEGEQGPKTKRYRIRVKSPAAPAVWRSILKHLDLDPTYCPIISSSSSSCKN